MVVYFLLYGILLKLNRGDSYAGEDSGTEIE